MEARASSPVLGGGDLDTRSVSAMLKVWLSDNQRNRLRSARLASAAKSSSRREFSTTSNSAKATSWK